ncbi:MAG: hypothetical protein LUQ70_03815 [Methanobacteriaceae archaeon]|nr:hypothetical protein [Methanobacteriaceae archaeon]
MENVVKAGPKVIKAHLKHLDGHSEKLLSKAIDFLKENNLEVPEYPGGENIRLWLSRLHGGGLRGQTGDCRSGGGSVCGAAKLASAAAAIKPQRTLSKKCRFTCLC